MVEPSDLPRKLQQMQCQRDAAVARVRSLEFELSHLREQFIHANDHADEPRSSPFNGELVLVVDDQPMNLELAEALLGDENLNLVTLASGEVAVAFMQYATPAIILMDVQMPGMDGYATAKAILATARAQQPVILAMTANNSADDEAQSLAAGMQGHLTKPIDADVLFEQLRYWLKQPPAPNPAEPATPQTLGTTPQDAPAQHSDAAQPSAPPETEPLPGIDIAAAMQRLRGNRKLFNEVLLSFADKAAQLVPDLQNFCTEGDLENATRLLHRLKGTSANLSANRLYNLAARLEQQAKQGHYPDEIALTDLAQAIDEITLSAARCRDEPPSNHTSTAPNPTPNPELKNLLTSLKDNLYRDLGEAQDLVEKVFDLQQGGQFAAQAKQVRADFYQFNIKAVSECLDRWLLQLEMSP